MKRISIAPLKDISLTQNGLNEVEVQQQRNRFGTNTILDSGKGRWQEIFYDTIRDPMIWFLVGVSFLFFLVDQKADSVALLIAIFPLVFMDAFLHWRTKSAVHSLKGNLSRFANVVRNSVDKVIDAKEVVPGDLLKLGLGEIVSADGIVTYTHELQINESVLTGESMPVKKKPYNLDMMESADEISIDNDALVFAGTKVLSGDAYIRIVTTGPHTEYGRIASSVTAMPHEKTPLQSSIGKLVRNLVIASLFFCILLVLVRLYQGHNWMDSVLVGLTLAVAAVPEEFPVVFSFFLGVGIFRLAKKRSLVRRAVSVENIGRITHICTDKTGTITQGKVTLSHLDPEGLSAQHRLLTAALAASNPKNGDPIDVAISSYASKHSTANYSGRIYRFPFTEDRKKETVIEESDQGLMAYSKGAPGKILESVNLNETEKKIVQDKVTAFAETGHKVLACAQKKLNANENVLNEPESGFEFLGLMAFEDPARPEVKRAIFDAEKNGIKVIMITGDHPATAGSIARDIGLGGEAPYVVSAEEYPDRFEDVFLKSHPAFLQSLDVIARCTPKQKLNVVQALKAQGQIVAVTGDGINDVPALKAADVGIAMGERGSQTAKEVSSIILLDDNFKTIVSAVEEGRQLFQNLQKAFEYLLLIHIPFVLSAALLPLLGYPIVFLPIHIVWLELIIHPSAVLAFQTSAYKGSSKLPVHFFETRNVLKIIFVSLGVLIFISVLFIWELRNTSERVARTEVLAALSIWSAAVVFSLADEDGLLAKLIPLSTVVLTLLLIQSGSPIDKYLHVTPLNWEQWAAIAIPVGSVAFILRYTKRLFVNSRKQFAAQEGSRSLRNLFRSQAH